MKLLHKIVSVLCLAVVSACFMAGSSAFVADKNYYEFNLYEKGRFSEFSAADEDAYYWIFDNRGYYDWNDEEATERDYLTDGDLLVTILHCSDTDCSIELNPELTENNNIIFDFTDEEKRANEQDYPGLAGYDGIIFRVAPEDDCENVCVISVRNKSVPEGSNEVSSPSFEGLNVNLDLYFARLDERFEYEVMLVNNTDDDLRISFDDAGGYVGYEVEAGDAKLPAHSRKTITVRAYIKADVPSGMLDSENRFTSSFVIVLRSDSVVNPATFAENLPIAILVVSCMVIVLLISKNKRGAVVAVIVALFGCALAAPATGVFASTRYELTINLRIEFEKKSRLTLLPNADSVEEGGDRIERFVKPDDWVVLTGGEFYRFGYLLNSWNSKPDGSGDNYWNEDSEYRFDKDTTLYAVWDPAFYVTLTDDDGVLTVSDQPFGNYDWRNGPYYEHYMIYKLRDVEHYGRRSLNPFQRSYSMSGCASDILRDVYELHINGRFAVKNTDALFRYAGCWNSDAKEVFRMDLSGLDTSGATSMAYMFDSVGSGRFTLFKDWSIGDLSGWNVSKVTDMSGMFKHSGYGARRWSVGDLSTWDVSNVETMDYMFAEVGNSSESIELGGIKNWDVSKVKDMNHMFSYLGYHGPDNCSLDLSGWNTSSLTDVTRMFELMCKESDSFSLDISSFDLSHVTEMDYMLTGAGEDATDWTVKIPKTNGNGLMNTTTRIYGANESIYFDAPEGRSFTLAD